MNDSFSQNKSDENPIDKTILQTDGKGYILSGDKNDWNYNEKTYNEIVNSEYLFINHNKNNPEPVGEGLYYEIIGDKLVLKWATLKEVNCKGFAVERAQIISDTSELSWAQIGYENGNKNSNYKREYKFTEKKLKAGNYQYRLKQELYDGSFEYINLDGEVHWMNFPSTLQFYPVFPNPVNNVFNIRFFLAMKDIISIFFINGIDTMYVIRDEQRQQGFHSITVDKNRFNFSNEIQRLYLKRNSLKRKEYYGDIKFN